MIADEKAVKADKALKEVEEELKVVKARENVEAAVASTELAKVVAKVKD